MTGRLNAKGRTPEWHAVPTKLTPTEFAFGHGDDYAEFIKQHCCRGDWAVNGEYSTPNDYVTIGSMTIFDPRDSKSEAFMVYYFEDVADAIAFKMKVA